MFRAAYLDDEYSKKCQNRNKTLFRAERRLNSLKDLFCIITGDSIEDSEVIQQVLGGNRNAYAEIIRKYEVRVRGFCLRMLSDASQSEDAAQEVFIKAYQALEKFKGESSFSTWIYRIASNHCFDLLRKRRRHKTESWDALVEKEGEKADHGLFAAQPDTGAEMMRSEQIKELLGGISEKHRQIIILREIQNLSYQELAEVLNCSLDAVKSRLKRARQELELAARHFLKPKIVSIDGEIK